MPAGNFQSNNPQAAPAAVTATGTNGAYGIDASSDTGNGVQANSEGGNGVNAGSVTGTGVFAQSGSAIAVHAVGGGATPEEPTPVFQAAVFAEGGPACGIYATSFSSAGVYGFSFSTGVSGASNAGTGVSGTSDSGTGVSGTSESGGTGVYAQSESGIGVHAVGGGATTADHLVVSEAAILAEGGPNNGVAATATSGTAVTAATLSGTSLVAITEGGIGISATATSPAGIALQVSGKIQVQGSSVGSVTTPAKTKTLTVSNTAATADSLIFLMPLGNPQAFLWIGARSAGSFTIDASAEVPPNVTIGYLIIN